MSSSRGQSRDETNNRDIQQLLVAGEVAVSEANWQRAEDAALAALSEIRKRRNGDSQ